MATLDDVCSGLDSIETAIKRIENRATSWWPYAIGAFMWLVVPGLLSSAWHSDLRYKWQYGLNDADIHRGIHPHDCNFLAAPLGDKYCHYDITVLEEEVRQSQQPGSYLVSQDGGKTWRPTETTYAYHGIWINWNKVDD
jgi:hypothetical protein